MQYICYLLLVIASVTAQTNTTDFLKTLAAESPVLKAYYLDYKQKTNNTFSDILPERPILSFENSEIPQSGSLNSANEKNIKISQRIDFPIIYKYKYDKNLILNDIEYYRYQEKSLNFLLNAKIEFYNYYILQKKNEILENFLKRFYVVYQQAVKLKKHGEISEVEYLRISLEYQNIKNEQIIWASSLKSQFEKLKLLLPSYSGELNDSLNLDLILNFSIIEENTLNLDPSHKICELDLKKENKSLDINYMNLVPDIEFSFMDQSINSQSFFGVEFSFSIPLWFPAEIENIERSQINISRKNTIKNNVENEIKSRLKIQWNKYQTQKNNYDKFLIEQIPISEKIYRISKKQYEAGQISYFEFIDNYRVWKSTRLSELDQRFSLYRVIANLKKTDLLKNLK